MLTFYKENGFTKIQKKCNPCSYSPQVANPLSALLFFILRPKNISNHQITQKQLIICSFAAKLSLKT